MSMARIFPRLSFQAKINLGVALIVVLSGVVSAVFIARAASRALSAEINARGANLGRNVAARAVEPVLTLDYLDLYTIVEQAKGLDDTLAYVFILDDQGDVMVHTFGEGFPVELAEANALAQDERLSTRFLQAGDDLVQDFAVGVTTGGVRIATARLGFSHRAQSTAVLGLVELVAAITAASMALGLAAGSVFARRVSRRLNTLRDFAEQLVSGRLDLRIAPRGQKRCWEELRCAADHCPAHGDDRLRCWLISGTLCADGHCSPGQSCEDCPVYKANRGDELQGLAESFDAMAVALRSRLDELKAKEEQLSAQKELLKTIFDVSPDLVCLLDASLCYRAVNKGFCEFFAVREEDLLGAPSKDFFTGLSDEAVRVEERAILSERSSSSQEVRLEKSGRELWMHVLKVPVARMDADAREASGLLITARDITRIKRYQHELVQSQKMESLGRLAGGVAHEINTPLAIILGYAQMLLEDAPKDSAEAGQLALIERHAQACRKIVSDLLTFSRQRESLTEAVDVNASLAEVLAVVKQIFQQEGVGLEFFPHPDAPRVEADRDKLKQVWMNLVTNAFDALPEGGLIVARVESDPRGGVVRVRLADTGQGIDPARLTDIFEPFYSTKPVGQGTGLGLSVSFGIIDEMGGTIRARSPAAPEEFKDASFMPDAPCGPGSVFIVELPLPGGPGAPRYTPSA